jgi:4-methylaminobutanoate oxidase (formaldehyde-forming)
MTADMDKEPGHVTYSLFCNPKGGILGDLTVARLSTDEFYVVTLAVQPGKVADQLKLIAGQLLASPSSDCIISDVTESRAVLALNGPRSREILRNICENALDNESFPPGTSQDISVSGMNMLALRVSFAGELGWELHCDAKDAKSLYRSLMEAGSSHGMVPAAYNALLNSLRVEKGFVHYGGEIGLTETPLEAGLAFACKLKPEQPDFVGKAALIEQRKVGWTKRLVSVQAHHDVDFTLWGHEQELLYRNGELVGSMTSGAYSHTLGRNIGLGYVRGPPKVPKKWLETGDYEVEVPVRISGELTLRRFPVQISTCCLVDPEGKRIRGDFQNSVDDSWRRAMPMSPGAERTQVVL